SAKTKRGPGLRAFRSLQLVFAVKSRDGDFRTQSGLGIRNWDRTVEGFAFAFKKRVRLDMQDDIKIARLSTDSTGITLSLVADSRSIFHAGRNAHLHGALLHHPALAFALAARIGNHTPRAAASRTGTGDGEESLLIPHLAATAATAARARPLSLCRAAALALFAILIVPDLDVGLFAGCGFFKSEIKVSPRVGSALRASATAASAY